MGLTHRQAVQPALPLLVLEAEASRERDFGISRDSESRLSSSPTIVTSLGLRTGDNNRRSVDCCVTVGNGGGGGGGGGGIRPLVPGESSISASTSGRVVHILPVKVDRQVQG